MPRIEVVQLGCRYQEAPTSALEGVDLVVRPGEIVAVMGHSGAGKSSLLKCLTGIVPSFEPGRVSGTGRVLGVPLAELVPGSLAGRVGMVFQDFEAQLFSTNVALEVGFGLDQLGRPRDEIRARTAEAVAAVGLAGFEARDPATLSGGEKQRLAMAAILALDPEIVLLDEPTTDIDPLGKAAMFDLLRAFRDRGAAVVVVEHESRAAEAADWLVLLSSGKVRAAGPSREVLRLVELLESSGVRPRDLDRLAYLLGIDQWIDSVDAAEELLRERGWLPSRARLDAARALAPSAHPQRAADHGQSVVAPLLSLRDVRYEYPSGTIALDGISLEIGAGEFVALIGQNGSGKTTLAKHLNGLLHPTGGRVSLRGRDTRELALSEIARTVGYVFQDPDHQLFCESVEAEVAYGPRHLGLGAAEVEARVARQLEVASLGARRDADPFLLSKGERQRLAVASVLALEPEALILDEPTTGLDYREQQAILGVVAELNRAGRTVIVITHAPWLVAQYVSRAVLMAAGRILFDGGVRELFAERELLHEASFALPDATALAMRFGVPARSVDELVAAIDPSIRLRPP